MVHSPFLRTVRCTAVWLAATGVLGVGWRVLRPILVTAGRDLLDGAWDTRPLDELLTELAALCLLACSIWLWAVTTAVVIEAARGLRLPVAAPAGVRRLVLSACGVALVGGLGQPALAVSTSIHQDGRSDREAHLAQQLDGLPLPDRALGAPPRAPVARTVVVVAPGDTLWDLARRDLPPSAPAAEITARWRAVYAANRAVIGADPDLIEPGQRLLIPERHPR